jgi:hypothetical protein
MAISGTVPGRQPAPRDPARLARGLRRATWLLAVVAGVWFFLRFGTAWVPRGMNTVPEAPPGSWCIVDRWAGGLRVGSDVFVDTPAGLVLSRVTALDAETVTIRHPNVHSGWRDSGDFGPLPRANVRSVVCVTFAPGGDDRGR